MGGLAKICKMMGGMNVSAEGQTVSYVWDYVADKAVLADEMPPGSERWAASEKKRWDAVGDALRPQNTPDHRCSPEASAANKKDTENGN